MTSSSTARSSPRRTTTRPACSVRPSPPWARRRELAPVRLTSKEVVSSARRAPSSARGLCGPPCAERCAPQLVPAPATTAPQAHRRTPLERASCVQQEPAPRALPILSPERSQMSRVGEPGLRSRLHLYGQQLLAGFDDEVKVALLKQRREF